MKTLENLIKKNREWAAEVNERDPHFFEQLAKQQEPEYLWIGCSDSRVPANQIVGLAPGEVFVHRNIANQVIYSDMNCMAVLEYAVDVLRVKHVIVCGHYGCGGVQAAMQENQLNVADNWICHVREIHRNHRRELEQIGEARGRFDRLCELNVIEQVHRLCHSTVVKHAWSRGQELCLHGWIYHIENGLLSDLNLCIARPEEVSPVIAAATAPT
jgi:carbonic anhydrase